MAPGCRDLVAQAVRYASNAACSLKSMKLLEATEAVEDATMKYVNTQHVYQGWVTESQATFGTQLAEMDDGITRVKTLLARLKANRQAPEPDDNDAEFEYIQRRLREGKEILAQSRRRSALDRIRAANEAFAAVGTSPAVSRIPPVYHRAPVAEAFAPTGQGRINPAYDPFRNCQPPTLPADKPAKQRKPIPVFAAAPQPVAAPVPALPTFPLAAPSASSATLRARRLARNKSKGVSRDTLVQRALKQIGEIENREALDVLEGTEPSTLATTQRSIYLNSTLDTLQSTLATDDPISSLVSALRSRWRVPAPPSAALTAVKVPGKKTPVEIWQEEYDKKKQMEHQAAMDRLKHAQEEAENLMWWHRSQSAALLHSTSSHPGTASLASSTASSRPASASLMSSTSTTSSASANFVSRKDSLALGHLAHVGREPGTEVELVTLTPSKPSQEEEAVDTAFYTPLSSPHTPPSGAVTDLDATPQASMLNKSATFKSPTPATKDPNATLRRSLPASMKVNTKPASSTPGLRPLLSASLARPARSRAHTVATPAWSTTPTSSASSVPSSSNTVLGSAAASTTPPTSPASVVSEHSAVGSLDKGKGKAVAEPEPEADTNLIAAPLPDEWEPMPAVFSSASLPPVLPGPTISGNLNADPGPSRTTTPQPNPYGPEFDHEDVAVTAWRFGLQAQQAAEAEKTRLELEAAHKLEEAQAINDIEEEELAMVEEVIVEKPEPDFNIGREDLTGITQAITESPIQISTPTAVDVVEAAVEPMAMPVAQPVVELSIDPVVALIVEPNGHVTERVTELMVEPIAEEVAAPIIEAVVHPVAQPTIEPVVVPVAEAVVHSVVETAEEIVSEVLPVVQPDIEAVVDLLEPAVSPLAEIIIEPIVETIAEPIVKPIIESIVEPVVEPVVESMVESMVETSIEPIAVIDPAACLRELELVDAELDGYQQQLQDILALSTLTEPIKVDSTPAIPTTPPPVELEAPSIDTPQPTVKHEAVEIVMSEPTPVQSPVVAESITFLPLSPASPAVPSNTLSPLTFKQRRNRVRNQVRRQKRASQVIHAAISTSTSVVEPSPLPDDSTSVTAEVVPVQDEGTSHKGVESLPLFDDSTLEKPADAVPLPDDSTPEMDIEAIEVMTEPQAEHHVDPIVLPRVENVQPIAIDISNIPSAAELQAMLSSVQPPQLASNPAANVVDSQAAVVSPPLDGIWYPNLATDPFIFDEATEAVFQEFIASGGVDTLVTSNSQQPEHPVILAPETLDPEFVATLAQYANYRGLDTFSSVVAPDQLPPLDPGLATALEQLTVSDDLDPPAPTVYQNERNAANQELDATLAQLAVSNGLNSVTTATQPEVDSVAPGILDAETAADVQNFMLENAWDFDCEMWPEEEASGTQTVDEILGPWSDILAHGTITPSSVQPPASELPTIPEEEDETINFAPVPTPEYDPEIDSPLPVANIAESSPARVEEMVISLPESQAMDVDDAEPAEVEMDVDLELARETVPGAAALEAARLHLIDLYHWAKASAFDAEQYATYRHYGNLYTDNALTNETVAELERFYHTAAEAWRSYKQKWAQERIWYLSQPSRKHVNPSERRGLIRLGNKLGFSGVEALTRDELDRLSDMYDEVRAKETALNNAKELQSQAFAYVGTLVRHGPVTGKPRPQVISVPDVEMSTAQQQEVAAPDVEMADASANCTPTRPTAQAIDIVTPIAPGKSLFTPSPAPAGAQVSRPAQPPPPALKLPGQPTAHAQNAMPSAVSTKQSPPAKVDPPPAPAAPMSLLQATMRKLQQNVKVQTVPSVPRPPMKEVMTVRQAKAMEAARIAKMNGSGKPSEPPVATIASPLSIAPQVPSAASPSGISSSGTGQTALLVTDTTDLPLQPSLIPHTPVSPRPTRDLPGLNTGQRPTLNAAAKRQEEIDAEGVEFGKKTDCPLEQFERDLEEEMVKLNDPVAWEAREKTKIEMARWREADGAENPTLLNTSPRASRTVTERDGDRPIMPIKRLKSKAGACAQESGTARKFATNRRVDTAPIPEPLLEDGPDESAVVQPEPEAPVAQLCSRDDSASSDDGMDAPGSPSSGSTHKPTRRGTRGGRGRTKSA